jgi:8-oxo-dGTP pyrophosphatase MutT (NUDIX family)
MSRDVFRKSVRANHLPLPNKSLHNSEILLENLIFELEKRISPHDFQKVELDYRLNGQKVLESTPLQIALIIPLISRGGDLILGVLNPQKTFTLLAKRSSNRVWGQDSWSFPMGKIEQKDISRDDESIGSVISSAAQREFREEIETHKSFGDYQIIAGSFLDLDTQNLIHVVLRQIATDEIKPDFQPQLPDLREHSRLGFVKLEKLPEVEPILPGTIFATLEGLQFLLSQNKSLKASKRFQDQ